MGNNSTVVGVPYKRVQQVVIDYPAEATAQVSVTIRPHARMMDGVHVPVGPAELLQFSVDPSDMSSAVPLVDPQTGESLGVDTTNAQIMVGIYSAIVGRMQAV